MRVFWQVFYSNVVLPILWALLQIAGMFNAKVRRGIRGRQRLLAEVAAQMKRVPPGKRVWVHSSSMGEFEQAKPIIVELKRRHPGVRVIASFFSPSGYDHSRKYPYADVITYLPFDTKGNAVRFIDLIRPDVAVMVRYDLWPNHVWELDRRRIPIIIANATLRSATKRLLPLARSFHYHMYDCVTAILTVSASDARVFAKFGITRPEITAIGDTRYDQVMQRSAEARGRHVIADHILGDRKVVVVGSSWPEDEAVVLPAILALLKERGDILLILVPHEPTVDHLQELEDELSGRARCIRFSALNTYNNEPVILVDSIGILVALYSCAHVAYVGGSFRQGVHNVLEAAVYGIPVVFGPRHRNSQEPLALVERGGAFVVNDARELERTLDNLFADETSRRSAGAKAAAFVESNAGATNRVLEHLRPYVT